MPRGGVGQRTQLRFIINDFYFYLIRQFPHNNYTTTKTCLIADTGASSHYDRLKMVVIINLHQIPSVSYYLMENT